MKSFPFTDAPPPRWLSLGTRGPSASAWRPSQTLLLAAARQRSERHRVSGRKVNCAGNRAERGVDGQAFLPAAAWTSKERQHPAPPTSELSPGSEGTGVCVSLPGTKSSSFCTTDSDTLYSRKNTPFPQALAGGACVLVCRQTLVTGAGGGGDRAVQPPKCPSARAEPPTASHNPPLLGSRPET